MTFDLFCHPTQSFLITITIVRDALLRTLAFVAFYNTITEDLAVAKAAESIPVPASWWLLDEATPLAN